MDSTFPAPSELAHHWRLDPQIVYLNHGSFGACPNAVLKVQQELRDRLERQPVQFLARDLEPMLDRSRRTLADFLHADAADLVFVPNATTGVNAVLRSFPFEPGDELLITNHGYDACSNAARFVTERAQAKVIVAPIPFPVRTTQEVIDAVMAAVTPRTRLALLDHVTSPTGLVLPIERLVAELEKRGVRTLVDGAHAPGMVPLDLHALNATYYTGNCHKWLCAPKGVAFLWCRRSVQVEVRPHVISHGAASSRQDRSRFQLEFDWVGTLDPTSILALPAAIEQIGSLALGGWPAVMGRNRSLAFEAQAILMATLSVEPSAPDEMIGSLVALPLPDSERRPEGPRFEDALQTVLLGRHGIEVPIVSFPGWPRRLIRISAQLYNSPSQYRYLGTALQRELRLQP